ncbi:hypothetical protein [Gaoshiqia sp. Z1-71]|uniref:hypothetical protein n=1 Tax=Gaoshiqia hydrogeniformans TaxID=3290090 RepID=UPI003BF90CE3
MRKLIVVTIISFFAIFSASAQDYNTGIGLRGGFFSGLTVKHFLNQSHAFEGLLSSRWHGLEITGLYEIHRQAFNAPRLNWYYGFGAHLGFYDGDRSSRFDDGDNYVVIGADGILGIEYNFAEIPINLGLDWKPVINLVGDTGFWGDGAAISIRYIF